MPRRTIIATVVLASCQPPAADPMMAVPMREPSIYETEEALGQALFAERLARMCHSLALNIAE